MKVTANMKQKAVQAITAYLGKAGGGTRREIIAGALAFYGYTEEQAAKATPSSPAGVLHSYIGTALSELVARQDICRVGEQYELVREIPVVVEESRCQDAILKLLGRRPYAKKELYAALCRHFGTDRTAITKDDGALRSMAGNVLARLVNQGRITKEGERYFLPSAPPKSAACLPSTAESFREPFFARLYSMGGPFFEAFLANLLEKYYLLTGREVLYCDVVGGSDDGGIDVMVETVDGLGFRDRVLVQAKCRARAQTTEKEIREFFGAFMAREGTRGIFATTATFHPGARRLLDTLENCVGLDGDKIYELVLKTSYGIHRTRKGYTFDEAIFSR